MSPRPFVTVGEFRRLMLKAIVGIGFALAWQALSFAADASRETAAGVLEYETQSAFSRIRIRKQGPLRSIIFVRDNGQEAIQSMIDVGQAHVPQFDAVKFLATSFLLRPKQNDVLIVGLGGGAMIHLLRHIDRRMQIDVVEIDPVVVRLADKYFNVRAGNGIDIITGDGMAYLAGTTRKYDVIYMDAFLKPSAATDVTGAPLSLRTHQFYQLLQTRLNPPGLVTFNLNSHAGVEEDVRNIDKAFPQTYVFPVSGGYVILGSTDATRIPDAELERRGHELDRQTNPPSMSFQAMARRLRR